jgi:chemotaxis protein CheX
VKVQYVNPFAQGALTVMQQVLNATPERGELSARPKLFTTQQINIVCGITGPVEGLVIYGMSMVTADKIASRMIGAQVVTFDQLAASAIAELGNMVSGTAMSLLAQQGLCCEITPPTIIRGTNVRITTLEIPAIVIPLRVEDIGTVEVNVSLQERRRAAVAV